MPLSGMILLHCVALLTNLDSTIMTRTRSRDIANNPGHVYRIAKNKVTGKVTVQSDTDGVSTIASRDWMIDEEFGDRKTPNGASSTHERRTGGIFNGYYLVDPPGGTVIGEGLATDYRMTIMQRLIPALPASQLPMLGELAMEATSVTNPGKPHMSLPVAIGELKDLPKTVLGVLNARNFQELIVRQAGDGSFGRYRKPKLTPRNHREYSRLMSGLNKGNSRRQNHNSIAEFDFGIMPLIRDIVNLFSIPKFVDDRIDRLRANAGVLVEHRSVYDQSSHTELGNFVFNSAHNIVVSGTIRKSYRESARATVVWTPKRSLYGTSDQSMRDYAMSMALGLTPMHFAYSMWELLPWSWLADWFGNTGDMLLSAVSSFDYSSRVTISVKRETKEVLTPTTTSDWGSATKGVLSRSSWTRSPNVTPLWVPIRPTPPILSEKQLLILLGIADNFRSPRLG